MDSYGFVFLQFVAGFNRIRQLTQDPEVLRYASHQSRTIELYHGADGYDRVRRIEGWQQWILAPDDREPSARDDLPNNGPPLPVEQAPPSTDMRYSESNRHSIGSAEFPAPCLERPGHDAVYAGVNGASQHVVGASFAPLPNGTSATTSTTTASASTTTSPIAAATTTATTTTTTTTTTMIDGDAGVDEKPLVLASGEDLTPAVPPPTFQEETQQREAASVDSFADRQVENLMMVIRDPASAPPEALRHPAVMRTFSNGSIDEKTIAEAFEDGPPRMEPRPNGNEGSYVVTTQQGF